MGVSKAAPPDGQGTLAYQASRSPAQVMHVPHCRLLTLLLWLAVFPHGLPEVDNFPCAGLCPRWLLQRSPNHVCRQPKGLGQVHRAELNCRSVGQECSDASQAAQLSS